MVSFSRRVIDGFARITEPLQRLLRKGVVWRFGDEERKAFCELKKRLMNAPVLGFPQLGRGKEFISETAYAHCSLGAMLSQEQDGKVKVNAYASRSLNGTERNYSDCETVCFETTWALLHFQLTFLNHKKEGLAQLPDCQTMHS